MTSINAVTSTIPGGPGLKRLRASTKAATVAAAVQTDQAGALAAAKVKTARGANLPTKKAATRSPSEPGKVAGKGKPAAKPAKTAKPASGKGAVIKVLSKELPYRPGSGLALMLEQVRDGMTAAELRAAFQKAGIKGQVSGFLHNARSKGLVE